MRGDLCFDRLYCCNVLQRGEIMDFYEIIIMP
jgi:hypothetical protein